MFYCNKNNLLFLNLFIFNMQAVSSLQNGISSWKDLVQIQIDTQDYKKLSNTTGLNEERIKILVNELKEKERGFVPSFYGAYAKVISIIETYGCKEICEIGVAFGTQCLAILEGSSVTKLYGVDPYKHFPKFVYSDYMNFEQDLFDVLYFLVSKRFDAYQGRAELVRKTSLDAVKQFSDSSFDMVYLDANHSYWAIKNELDAWYPKVKKGGVLAGDDYTYNTIQRALAEFSQEHGFVVNVDTKEPFRTWWIHIN